MYTGGAPLSTNSFGPGYATPGQWPLNRHVTHRGEGLRQGVERSRIITRGGKRMKVPIALGERPEWSLHKGGGGVKDWAELEGIERTCRKLVVAKNVEERLHSAFALARCSNVKRNREPLALTKGVAEAITHTLLHSEPSESGRRCQLHALTALHNMLLESPKVDVYFGHDEGVLSGLLHCLEIGDLPMQELAVTCLDFLAISDMNQGIMIFKTGLLDLVSSICKTTRSGYALYHALHTITYLSMCERGHHVMVRHGGVVGVLRDVLLDHDSDPSRCQQGLLALCYLATGEENAKELQGLGGVVANILRETRDGGVGELAQELAVRMRVVPYHPEAAPTPRRVSFSEVEVTPKSPLALLDQYEADLNAAIAQLGTKTVSPPRPSTNILATLQLEDSDSESDRPAHHPRLGSFAVPGTYPLRAPSPTGNGSADVWSVSGESDI